MVSNAGVKMVCSCVVIGDIVIPAFTLYKNKILCIKLPRNICKAEINTVFNMLLKKYRTNSLKVFGKPSRVGVLLFLNDSLFFRYKWYKKTALDYLKTFANLSTYQAEEVLCSMNIFASTTVKFLSCTQRLLIEIEIACSHSDVLIFSLDGLDPLGSNIIVEYVRSKLFKISAICICTPLVNNVAYYESDACSDTNMINEEYIYVHKQT
ncbi:hypothetical protein [Beggiatoa leptomitoformis]|uniref:Uncharacterized protein n=1 Tax=Beggiatoa leptomitoformis TaxID=288004 RepID=A0A2N9YE34_9GAMM|nr:hypothetical protein [Beggiatoa leptomitoformis]ALG68901.1 hypothetical protein AL038_15855 [Beggiatoa leptomitoformis]AUI68724.1 hypothetical protein BLE401_08405 [Beggiatoa leptomitoformis]